MDMSASQKAAKAEDFIVFQDVALLPLVDINEDEPTTTGTLVMTKYELVFADEKVCISPIIALANLFTPRKRKRAKRTICYLMNVTLQKFRYTQLPKSNPISNFPTCWKSGARIYGRFAFGSSP